MTGQWPRAMQEDDRRVRPGPRRSNQCPRQGNVAVTKHHLFVARQLLRGKGHRPIGRAQGDALGSALAIHLELDDQFDRRPDREARSHGKLGWRNSEERAHEPGLVVAEQQDAVAVVGDEAIDPQPLIAAEAIDPIVDFPNM